MNGEILLELYIVRHAQSFGNAHNEENIPEYHPDDPPLTRFGKSQAEALGEYFKGEGIDYFFASTLLRAVETAYPAAVLCGGKTVELLTDLMEVGTGLPGSDRELLEKSFPLALFCGEAPTGGSALLNEETREKIQLRGQRCASYFLSRFKNGERVLAVTHGGFFGYFVRALLNLGLNDSFCWMVSNASVTKIVFRRNELPLLCFSNYQPFNQQS